MEEKRGKAEQRNRPRRDATLRRYIDDVLVKARLIARNWDLWDEADKTTAKADFFELVNFVWERLSNPPHADDCQCKECLQTFMAEDR